MCVAAGQTVPGCPSALPWCHLGAHLVSGTVLKAPRGREVSSGAPGRCGERSGATAEAVGGRSPCRNHKIKLCWKPGGSKGLRKNILAADELHPAPEALSASSPSCRASKVERKKQKEQNQKGNKAARTPQVPHISHLCSCGLSAGLSKGFSWAA